MNHLIAKVNGKKGNFFKVISSNKEIFQSPEYSAKAKEYNPNYKLEEDEWFVISGFKEREF